MSTKALEKVLRDMRCEYAPCQPTNCRKHEARAELGAIRGAEEVLSAEVLDVEASVAAIGLMQSIAKESL